MVWMFKNERMSWKKNNVLVVNNKNTNCSYYYQKAKQVLNILFIEMRIYIWYYNRNLNIRNMQNWNWYNSNSKQKIMSSKSIWMKLGKKLSSCDILFRGRSLFCYFNESILDHHTQTNIWITQFIYLLFGKETLQYCLQITILTTQHMI